MVYSRRSPKTRNIDRNTLKQSIIEIQKSLKKDVRLLNDGGCVHFAYYFSKKLKEHNINHKIVLYDCYEKPFEALQSFGGISHVSIYIKGIGYIDGHSTYKLRQQKSVLIKPEHLNLNTIRNFNGWNKSYELENNSIVRKVINNNL